MDKNFEIGDVVFLFDRLSQSVTKEIIRGNDLAKKYSLEGKFGYFDKDCLFKTQEEALMGVK